MISRSSRTFRRARKSEFPAASIRPCALFADWTASRFLSSAREGREHLGRRWQRIHRLRRHLGAGDSRSCAESRHGAVREARNARRKFRHSESTRSRDGGTDLRMGAVDRKSADGQQRHGGDDVVHAAGARIHRARQDHQVRRLLSRPCRFAAGESRQRRAHAWSAGQRGRAAGICRAHDCAAVQ